MCTRASFAFGVKVMAAKGESVLKGGLALSGLRQCGLLSAEDAGGERGAGREVIQF